MTITRDYHLLSQLANPIILKDEHSVYAYSNQTAASLTGFANPKEMIGIRDADLKCQAAELCDLFIKQDQLTLKEGHLHHLDLTYYADGKLHALMTTKTRVIDEKNQKYVVWCANELPLVYLSNLIMSLKDLQDN